MHCEGRYATGLVVSMASKTDKHHLGLQAQRRLFLRVKRFHVRTPPGPSSQPVPHPFILENHLDCISQDKREIRRVQRESLSSPDIHIQAQPTIQGMTIQTRTDDNE